ncbi:hypothetical protein [uncultured Mediterranean phage]|nr:hypothetical protein [uncultured Mediterranean phage]
MSAKLRSRCHLLLGIMGGCKGKYIYNLPFVPQDHLAYVRTRYASELLKSQRSKPAVLMGRKLYYQLPPHNLDDVTPLAVSKKTLTIPTFDGISSAQIYCQEKSYSDMYILGGLQLANSAMLHPSLDSIIIRTYNWRPFANSIIFPTIPPHFRIASTVRADNLKSPHTYVYNNTHKDLGDPPWEPEDTLGLSLPPCGLFTPS